MIRSSTIDIQAALADRESVERACIAAARQVIKLHRFHDQPVVTSSTGDSTTIPVDEFERRVNEREAALNREFGRTPS